MTRTLPALPSQRKQVTAAQAREVERAVRKRFRAWIDAERWHARTLGGGRSPSLPKLVRRYEPYWGGGTIPYAILWEGGPDGWVACFLWGEPDEVGRSSEPPRFPALFLEAGTSFILGIYPAG